MKTVQSDVLSIALIAIAAVALISGALAPALRADDADPGQEAFVGNKCNMCHSVESLGIERTSTSDKMKAMDLSTAGDDYDLEWFQKFIRKEVEREGELHKRTFKGTDEEADAIAHWLTTLTAN